jgi:ribosomal protein S17
MTRSAVAGRVRNAHRSEGREGERVGLRVVIAEVTPISAVATFRVDGPVNEADGRVNTMRIDDKQED